MKSLSYELSLIHSPYFDKLLSEIKIILDQKRRFLSGIHSRSDFNNKLSYAEKGIYDSIEKREKELLLELIQIKGWSLKENESCIINTEITTDYDEYDSNFLPNIN